MVRIGGQPLGFGEPEGSNTRMQESGGQFPGYLAGSTLCSDVDKEIDAKGD